MRRTTVSLDEPTLQWLRDLAAVRGVTLAAVIRDLLEEKLAASRPIPRSLGAGASGHSDTARRTADEPIEPPAWR